MNNFVNFDHVILVDDDPTMNFIHQKMIMLNEFAREVSCFHQPEQALSYLKRHADSKRTEIILLDIKMPLIDGFSFLEKYERLISPDKIPIAILTSSLNAKDYERATEYSSVIGFFNKPLNGEKLQQIKDSWRKKALRK